MDVGKDQFLLRLLCRYYDGLICWFNEGSKGVVTYECRFGDNWVDGCITIYYYFFETQFDVYTILIC